MGVYGVSRAAEQLYTMGRIDRLPHLLCVQQETCAPMVSAWEAGAERIRPEDISHVYIDQNAKVKFTAYRYRSTSMATGKVTYVSGDRLIDRANNFPYYSVMILVDADSLRSAGDLKVTAGMPAEVYIEGTKQTPLQYLTEPITSTVRKAGRQI